MASTSADVGVGSSSVVSGPPVAFSAVVLGEHAGDVHERHRALALAGVHVTVAARHAAGREPGRLAWRVREEPETAADFL